MVLKLLKYIYIYLFFFKIDLSWAFDHVYYKLFYGKSVIHFHQREIAIVLFPVILYAELNFIFISVPFVNFSTDVNDQDSQSPEAF